MGFGHGAAISACVCEHDAYWLSSGVILRSGSGSVATAIISITKNSIDTYMRKLTTDTRKEVGVTVILLSGTSSVATAIMVSLKTA